MQLNEEEKKITTQEIRANMEIGNIDKNFLAENLGCSAEYINEVLSFKSRVEDIWIIRNFLINYVAGLGKTPLDFTYFSGDFRRISYLDKKYIGKSLIVKEN